MTREDPIEILAGISREFGPAAARTKARLLDAITEAPPTNGARLAALCDTLGFLRAYPDDAGVRRRTERIGARLRDVLAALPDRTTARLANSGIPGSANLYSYSYAVLQRLVRQFPGCLEIDWDELEDGTPIHNALVLLVSNNECQGLDDIRLTMPEWAAGAKPDPAMSDLDLILGLFESSGLGFQEQAYVFESCGLPIRYRLRSPGTGRCEVSLPRRRIHYQRTAIARDREPVEPQIRAPLDEVQRLTKADGEAVIAAALAALCSRNLEISSLIYADPGDVTMVECGRGLQVALVGVIPEYRDALEVSCFFSILKNGVPIAYGPASVCLGCCEMGINLFPEFRGGEIRFVYAQFMRALHHVLGVELFYLTPYGMGEGNSEAIRTGAFWFYRKLGFRPDNPKVETLAREEEVKMAKQAAHRSSTATLRRLSHTSVHLDMSGGACQRIDLGAIGLRQSRVIAREFGGDRKRTERECMARIARLLELGHARQMPRARAHALRVLAPVLCMIPGLRGWPAVDKKRLARIVRSKGGRSDNRTDGKIRAAPRLLDALRTLAADG